MFCCTKIKLNFPSEWSQQYSNFYKQYLKNMDQKAVEGMFDLLINYFKLGDGTTSLKWWTPFVRLVESLLPIAHASQTDFHAVGLDVCPFTTDDQWGEIVSKETLLSASEGNIRKLLGILSSNCDYSHIVFLHHIPQTNLELYKDIIESNLYVNFYCTL